MRILSIDSSLGTQVALLDADPAGAAAEVLVRLEQAGSRAHAESLGPMLAEALSRIGAAGEGLDAVVAATGPAPFTGLRAGLVAARTLGRARAVPVHGVPSLDAVARLALDGLGATGRGTGPVVLVTTDARRKEVYAARYRAQGPDDVERLDPLAVGAPAQALDLGPFQAVAGSAVPLYPELGRASSRPALAPVSGEAVTQVRLALARLARGEQLDTEPIYLRHADVHLSSSRKRVS